MKCNSRLILKEALMMTLICKKLIKIKPHSPVINIPKFNDLAEILHNVPPTLMQGNNRGSLVLLQTPTQEMIDVTTLPKFQAQFCHHILFGFPICLPNFERWGYFEEELGEEQHPEVQTER